MLFLPNPIRSYFDASARFDLDGMLALFSRNAVVHDEARTHRGLDEIRAWIDQATIANKAIAVPEAIRTEDRIHHVTASVSGEFPGSPIDMTFHFRIAEDRVAELEID